MNINTNIKGLPEGRRYFTAICGSDQVPYVVTRVTRCTVTLNRVNVKRDPEFQPEFEVGGFAAHCKNQQKQTWLYDGVSDDTITVRQTKKGWSYQDTRFVEDKAVEFYDYNF